jgi:hypothetical protein
MKHRFARNKFGSKILFFLFTILLITNSNSFSQTNDFKIEAYYNKSKELFVADDYSSTLNYIKKIKALLGGSNEALQYMSILCYVKTEKWVSAREELTLYFDLIEDSLKAKPFPFKVGKLKENEINKISNAMLIIEENETPQKQKERVISDISQWFNKFSDGYDYTNKVSGDEINEWGMFTVNSLYGIVASEENGTLDVNYTLKYISDAGVKNCYYYRNTEVKIYFNNIDHLGIPQENTDNFTKRDYLFVKIFLKNSITQKGKTWDINSKKVRYNKRVINSFDLPIVSECNLFTLKELTDLVAKFNEFK